MRAVYISPNPADQARANALGLGLILQTGVGTPFALVQGAGLSFTHPEPINVASLQADENTILTAEAANDAAAATQSANAQALLAKAANAVTANLAYLALGAPTNAQVVGQVAALTRQVDALIRLAANQLTDTSGT